MSNVANNFWIYNKLEFYNVLFENIPDVAYCYFGGAGGFEMYNCTLSNKSNNMLRCTHCDIHKLTNCYGPFTSGYNTQQSQWDYQTNRILTSNPTLTSDYRITEADNLWKNVGTGTNPDGTRANLGIYGGQFSWDFDLDDIE